VKEDRVYLQHIRDALEDITACCGNDHDAFINDRMRQDATLGVNLEIVWAVVQKELPKLKVAVASLLSTPEVR
jgi:uncharacterized protein with HEPN domain